MNFKNFKKVSSNDDHTVLQHPEGHQIKVLHKPLSKDMRTQLNKLPSMEGRHQSNPKLEQSHVKDKVPHFDGGGTVTIDPDKAKSIQDSFRGATHYKDGGSVKVNEDTEEGTFLQSVKDAFTGPTPTPAPETQEEKYERIRRQNKANVGYADGGKVEEVQGEAQPVMASKLEAQYAPEEENAQAAAPMPQQASPSDAHADLSKAVMNLTQKYAQPSEQPQSAPQQTQPVAPPEDKAGLAQQSPVASPEVQPQQVSDQVPQGSLIQQAQGDVSQSNKAEMASAQNTQAALGKEADIHGQEAQQMQALHQKYEQIGNDLHQKYDKLSTEVEQGKIDPHQWWDSKSTGSKVMTAIGMLLSGAGAGVSGHPELAAKFVDQAIDRDIEAQKSNLQNKNSLLGKYMEMYNSLPMAEQAARLTLSAGVEGMLKQQAAKLGSANAINAAVQANAQRRQQLLPQLEGLAKGQVMADIYKDMGKAQSGAQQGGAEQAYQKRMGDMRILNPDLGKDMENKYLPGVGVSRVPVPDKLREEISTRKDLSDKLANLENFAKQHSGTVLDRSVVNQGKAMAAQVQDAYRTAHQQGVFKESEKNFVESVIKGDPTAFLASTRTLPGYRQARKFNDDTVKQYYKSYGIKPFEGQSQSNDQSAAAKAWLESNPNDPRAAAVRAKLGM